MAHNNSGMGWSGIVSIPIPPDGATGQVLTKSSPDDYDTDWAAGGGGGGLPPDGDYGNITVSGVGTVWTIDNDVVTFAKMQNSTAADVLIGRGNGGGAGDFQEITLGPSLSMTGTVIDAVGAGATVGAAWNFDTSTVAADPGSKKFRLNNATLASVTNIYVNDTTVGNFDASTVLGFMIAGNRVYIQQANDATRAALFVLSGPPVDNTGWWTIPVTTVDDGGVLYQNNAQCAFIFLLTVAGAVADADYGDITVSGAGSIWTIDNDVVTYAKMQNVSAASRLLGRGSAGGAGNPEELTLGTNLSLSGTVLNATGGGGASKGLLVASVYGTLMR